MYSNGDCYEVIFTTRRCSLSLSLSLSLSPSLYLCLHSCVVKGEWLDGLRHGKGKMAYANGGGYLRFVRLFLWWRSDSALPVL